MTVPEDPAFGRLFVVIGDAVAQPALVGRSLAQALQKSVFVDGETIDSMVTAGRMPIGVPPTVGGLEQLYTRYAAALTLADVYRTNGFDAVLSDFMSGDYLTDFLDLADTAPLHLIVLHPPFDTIVQSQELRGISAFGADSGDDSNGENEWNDIEFNTRRVGLWIDNSAMTPAQIVVHILRNLGEATVTPVS